MREVIGMEFSTILIVDDNAEILKLLEIELFSHGYSVVHAKNGQEAIKKAEDILPDLILMDLVMPDMDGGQVIKKLKSSTKTKQIPIILLTAMLTRDEEKRGQGSILVDDKYYPMMAKPYNAQDLLEHINKLIHLPHV